MARKHRSIEALDEGLEGPLRTCIVKRVAAPPEDLIRFVAGPDASVVADIRLKLPGRGVWVTNSAASVAEAGRRQLFARALKSGVKASDRLADEVDRLLESDALQSLSLVNKAGLVTCGAAKVEQALEKGDVVALLHAHDGGADGARKLGQVLARHGGNEAAPVRRLELFESSQLDLALGRTNVIHAALKTGAASAFFIGKCDRLARYRGALGPAVADPGTGASPAAELDFGAAPGEAADETAGDRIEERDHPA